MSMTQFKLLPNTPVSAFTLNAPIDVFTLNTSASYIDTSGDTFIFATKANAAADISVPVPNFAWAAEQEFNFGQRPASDLPANSGTTEGDDARGTPEDNTEGSDARGDGDGNVIRPTYGDDGKWSAPVKCESFPTDVKPTFGDDAKTSPTPDTDLPSSGPCQGYVGSVRPDDTPGTVFPTPTPDKVVDKPVVETVTEVVCVMPPPEKVVTEVVCVMPTPGKVVTDIVCVMPKPTPEIVQPIKEIVVETGTVVCDPPATETGTDFNLKAWFDDDTIVFQPKADVDTTPFIPNPFVIEMIGTDPAPSKGEVIPTDTWVEPIIGNQPMHIDKGELLAA